MKKRERKTVTEREREKKRERERRCGIERTRKNKRVPPRKK